MYSSEQPKMMLRTEETYVPQSCNLESDVLDSGTEKSLS